MNTIPESELITINGGLPFDLPPQMPSPPLIDSGYWLQRELWAYLYDD